MRVVIEASKGRPNRYDCRDCHRVSRLQQPVDELIEAVLIARLSKPDVLAALSVTSSVSLVGELASATDFCGTPDCGVLL
jgi:hypothetical protein